MDNEIVQPELDMPQLRQMVLDNAKRIDRNELMINIMREKTAKQTRKISERDEWLENLRQENDRSMRESRERMDRLEKFAEASKIEQDRLSREIWKQLKENSAQMKESREDFDRRMKERDEKFDREMKERDEKFDREMKESREAFDKRMKERDEKFDREMKERRESFDKQIEESRRETNAMIRHVSVELLGVTGHIVEGLVSSSTEKIFRDAGFDLHNSGKNLKRELASENRQMELDVMLGNDRIVVPVEVKANFTKKKVKRWLHKMETFRDFFPECADKEVVAAVAAINYEAGADTLAHDEGLLVIRVSSDDIFSLDPVDEEKLRRF